MSDKSTSRDGLQWAVMRGNRFRVCERTVDRLPAGAYTCTSDDLGTCVFEQRKLEVDDLIDFPGSLAAQLLDEIERFWTLGDRISPPPNASGGSSSARACRLPPWPS
ncbi:MAG TPA: hypothetical protein PLF81_21700 [Candidatus Anammoximicrobium sp.]|nr:hypothetical protein [Candidatus Anammoximicrobium sp.]